MIENKVCIKSMTLPKLEEFLVSMGEPKYRAKQIFKWLSQNVKSFDEMSDISKKLREKLNENCYINDVQIVSKQVSKLDGTIKYLFELQDGNCIETVLMQYEHGNSICISTQAGCKMGCAFCASFDKGKTRNLTPAEIYDQILSAQYDSGRKVSNIVLMGTGEPLDNYDNVIDFLRIISDENGVNIGMRHISLSTCGLVPKIYELAKLKLQLTLSISLHCPIDEIRSTIMPVNKTYNVDSLIKACKDYFKVTGRRISFEYAMIDGKTDSKECADKLIEFFKGFPAHMNLIPLNHVEGSPLEPTPMKKIKQFQNYLIKNGINTTIRRSLGGDISASCGQLRKKYIEEGSR